MKGYFLLLILLFLFYQTPRVQAQEERTWTDNTGQFSFEGTFVRAHAREVMLKRSDGQLLRVSLTRLSEADRDYVDSLNLANSDAKDPLTGIAWYGRVEPAFEEAKRSKRPVLFMAAATQCSGVPGVF